MIRLACHDCDRDDYDHITKAQLEQCKADGWRGITVEQTYKESIRVPKRPRNGFNLMAWYTHLGTCPECSAGE